ncbi:MAG: purine-nucleoside phosphorylase [Clostridia bacterium]|nr:purine-nucleoside phosphorylase [Clostridia bacterium]
MSVSYPTPHINAKPEDFAKTVLMPGDPLRAKFIADNYLTDAKLINNVRNIQGYTGYYNGVKVSVMASGMGIPSMGIYSYELYKFFGVENIIRIGSAGSLNKNVKILDIVFAMGVSTDSNYSHNFDLNGTFAPMADYYLLTTAVDIAKNNDLKFHVGNVLSSDMFYNNLPFDNWQKMGVLAVEMETASLYMNAANLGKRALALYTVSDSIVTGETTTSEQRRTVFTDMLKLALDTAVKLDRLETR